MRNYSNKSNTNGRNYNLILKSKYNDKPIIQKDAFTNPIARLGVGTDNIINAGTYQRESITQDYQLLNTLYRDNWIVQNIVETIPNDITKKWFTIKGDISPEDLNKFDKLYRNTHLIKSVNEGLRWGRLYGGALGIIMIKGQTDDLSEPLDCDLITPDSFLGLFIVDRWIGAYPSIGVVKNPESPDFGLPEYYDITDSTLNLTTRVHHSKVIRFIGRELSRDERIREVYWGASELESVYRELVRRDTTAENIASLVFKANLSVMKIKDLDQIFAINSVQAQNMFWNTLESISTIESSLGIKLVDAESDASFLNYSFAGIKDIYEGLMLDLAGATHIPVTKLFGRSPAGMNSTGESDLQNYYDYIDSVREGQFRDIVMKLLPIISLSVLGTIPDDLDFEFEEMKTLSDTEKAQLTQQYTSTIIEAFNSNLITQDIAQKELKNISEITGIFSNIDDELIEQSKGKFINDLQQMNDPMAGMMGGDMGGMPAGGGIGEGMDGFDNNIPTNNPNQKTLGIIDNEDSLKDNENYGNKITSGIQGDVDETERILNEIKNRLINNKTGSYYNIEGIGETVNQIENTFAEYKRIEKLLKKAEKEYNDITNNIYQYNNKLDIPLIEIEQYNKVKNKYDNLLNEKSRLLNEINNSELNKVNSSNLTTDNEGLKNNYSSLENNNYSRLDIINLIDKLIEINTKLTEYRAEKEQENKNKKVNEIETILNKYNKDINTIIDNIRRGGID